MPSGIIGRLGIDSLVIGDLQIFRSTCLLAGYNIYLKRDVLSHLWPFWPFLRPHSLCVR
jgi:hypothetical protein